MGRPSSGEEEEDQDATWIVVTGGNKGIGQAMCKRILCHHPDAHMLLGSRSQAPPASEKCGVTVPQLAALASCAVHRPARFPLTASAAFFSALHLLCASPPLCVPQLPPLPQARGNYSSPSYCTE